MFWEYGWGGDGALWASGDVALGLSVGGEMWMGESKYMGV